MQQVEWPECSFSKGGRHEGFYSSPSRAISCRSRLFSALSRMRAFQLLAAQLRVAVKEKCARQMAWMTADLTRRGQPRGKGILGGGGQPAMKASKKGIYMSPFPE